MRFFRRNKNLRSDLLLQSKTARIKTKFNFFTIISTWFYIGKSPLAPGTVASLSTYPLYQFALNSSLTYDEIRATLLTAAGVLYILGLWCVHKFQEQTKTSDNQIVVIDEVVGQLLTFGLSYTWLYKFAINYAYMLGILGQSLAFCLGILAFRYFDIAKPFGIRYIDKVLKGSFGVMLDDIMAALLASGTIYIIYRIYDTISIYIQ